MNKKTDLAKLHISVMLMGLAGVIGKFVTWPATAISFGRVLFSSVFLFILMTVKKEKIRLDSGRDYLLMIAAGIVMGIHWTMFFKSIQVSSVAIGTITFATFPLFVTFIEPLIYKEKLRPSNIIISLVMIAGVVITVPEFSLSNTTSVGVLWGMGGAATYAILSLMNRYFSSKYSGRQVCLYEQGTATVFLLPFAVSAAGTITFTITEVCAVIFLGVVCTALGHSLFVGSLRSVKVHTAGIVSGMETVYSIVFAMILLGQMISGRELIGGIIILGASLYKSIKSQ